MSDPKGNSQEHGYKPSKQDKGYQPNSPSPSQDPRPQGGYVPTSEGDNPSNSPPSPPGDE